MEFKTISFDIFFHREAKGSRAMMFHNPKFKQPIHRWDDERLAVTYRLALRLATTSQKIKPRILWMNLNFYLYCYLLFKYTAL